MIHDILTFLTTSANWHGPDGVPARLSEHAEYSVIALVIATLIALPLGLVIGHTGRGTAFVSGIANSLRALPTIGLLIFFVVLISPHIHGKGDAAYLIPTEIVLVLLAVPSILSNTYAGVQNVDPAVRDAAKGMGMTGIQVLFKVELPCALQLIISGIRSATLQVVATATIAAYVSLGGFGRFVFDGLSQQDYAQMASGALLVAVLAVAADLGLALLQRAVVSRGIAGRYAKSGSRRFSGPANAPGAELTEAEFARI
ncbi:osmoprotectant transport system permease protein [Catenulispora sp. GAS73]|uniref:ABC transporter permease n=1 Tax=Catenulispora sp. GAS73 TaxID=3156269 RepID=UPI003518509C